MRPRIAAANPLAVIGTGIAVDLVLLVGFDAVTAGAAVVLELLLAPLAGLRGRGIAIRVVPLAVAAALAWIGTALYGRTSGVVHLHWGLVTVSDGSMALATTTALRVLAIAIPALVLLPGIDATGLADALAQRLRLPARFVLAALAAVRLVELLGEDRRAVGLARRARGLGDGGRLRRLLGEAFGLMVAALRRATALATTMEARGLGAPGPRTWTRPSRFGRTDTVVVAAGAVVAGGSLAIGIATGSWHVLLG